MNTNSLTEEGLLKNFVTRWMMLVQQELMMSLGVIERTKVIEEDGITVDSSQLLGA